MSLLFSEAPLDEVLITVTHCLWDNAQTLTQQSMICAEFHSVPFIYSVIFTWDQGKCENVKTMKTTCRQGRQMSHGG